MPVPDRERASHMALRLERTARKEGVEEGGLLLLAHRVAMTPRHRELDDDHDPRYLHPGRVALVAMTDAGLRDPLLLAAGILLETLSPGLAPNGEEVAATGDPRLGEAWAVASALPRPRAEALAEALVTAGEGERIVALAEWTDQLRHLRHWADGATVGWAHDRTREVYLPVAERTHPTLARRLRWWITRVDPEGRGA